eukprot:1839521-Rhodomonas_salina.1
MRSAPPRTTRNRLTQPSAARPSVSISSTRTPNPDTDWHVTGVRACEGTWWRHRAHAMKRWG